MRKLARLKQHRWIKKLLPAVLVALALIAGFIERESWLHRSFDSPATWDETQFVIAWVSASKDYGSAERFIKSTASSRLPRITEHTSGEQIEMRFKAAKAVSIDLMRTLSRQQVAYMNRNGRIPYTRLTSQQKKMLILVESYTNLGTRDLSQANLQKSYMLVNVIRSRDRASTTQFGWYIDNQDNYRSNILLMACRSGGIIVR